MQELGDSPSSLGAGSLLEGRHRPQHPLTSLPHAPGHLPHSHPGTRRGREPIHSGPDRAALVLGVQRERVSPKFYPRIYHREGEGGRSKALTRGHRRFTATADAVNVHLLRMHLVKKSQVFETEAESRLVWQ